MTWWCSAQGQPWTWTWQAYPGAWLLIGVMVGTYWWGTIRLGVRAVEPTGGRLAPRKSSWTYLLGTGAVWLAVDWPIGTLGAGYLLSVHQLQYVLLVMVAPPLLLFGTPGQLWRWVSRRALVGRVFQQVTRPVAALAICNAVVVLTHLPSVVDGFMSSQFGSFVVDMSWLGAGALLWWPVLSPLPEGNPLSYPARFGYLLAVTILPGFPSAFFFFAKYPIYALYELAPPIAGISTMDDQFVAGVVMKLGTFVVVVIVLSVIFFRWHAQDKASEPTIVLPKGLADA